MYASKDDISTICMHVEKIVSHTSAPKLNIKVREIERVASREEIKSNKLPFRDLKRDHLSMALTCLE